MQYTRAHGTGNDFVVLLDLDDHLELDDVLVRALCHRRFGVGADGVLRIGAGSDGADVFMDYRNADGSIGEMCGNGVRVVAKHVLDHQYVVPRDGTTVVVGTRAGNRSVRAHVTNEGLVDEVTVDMGPPLMDPTALGVAMAAVASTDDEDRLHLDVGGTDVALTAVGMGNPHAVIVVDDVDTAPVATLGPAIERHAAFPDRVNVEFAEVVDPHHARLRVWERGVGETAACGTGACATLVALKHIGLLGAEATIDVPGGTLRLREQDGSILLTGPAIEVSHGTLDEAWLRRARVGAFEQRPLVVTP